MATATRGRRRGATKPAAVEEVEELEDVEELGEDEDVEELELDEPEELEEEPAPRRRRGAKAAPAKAAAKPAAKKAPARRAAKPVEDDEDEDTGPTYDSNWLAEYVNETCGTDYDSRALRMLLRKLAHAGTIQREVGTDRSRYTFPKGANDPIVRAVVRAVKSGAVEEAKSDGIAKAQASKATKKTAAKAAPAKATRRTRRTRAVEVDDEEDED